MQLSPAQYFKGPNYFSDGFLYFPLLKSHEVDDERWHHVAYKSWLVIFFKGKDLRTCYSAAYMSQTRDQQHFTI